MTVAKNICGAELEVLELDVSLEAPVLDAELYGNELEAELPSGSALLEVPVHDWDGWVEAYGRGYDYYKPTGDLNTGHLGDDYWVETNIFAPLRLQNGLRAKNQLTSFGTLLYSNEFGNYTRLTDDLGGTQYGGLYYWSDYATGVDGWTNQGAVPIGSIDGILGENDVLKAYAGSTTTNAINRSIGNGTDNYTLSGKVMMPSTNTNANSLMFARLLTSYAKYLTPTPDQWVDFSFDMQNLTNTGFRIYLKKNNVDFLGTNNPNDDLCYFKDIKLNLTVHNGSTEGYLIDNFTGLSFGRIKNPLSGYVFDTSLSMLMGTDHGGQSNLSGYTDWFCPNQNIIHDVKNAAINTPLQSPFKAQLNNYGYESTTSRGSGDDGYRTAIGFRNTIFHNIPHTLYFYLPCRKHF